MAWPYVDPRLPNITGEPLEDISRLWKALYALERDRVKKYSLGGGIAHYSSGTWTPTDASGAGLGLTVLGTWTKTGRLVTLQGTVIYPATASGANAAIGGIPFTSGATSYATSKAYSTSALGVQVLIAPSGTGIGLFDALGGAALTNVQMTGATVIFTLSYEAIGL